MISHKTTTGSPDPSSRSNRFLACFGFSGEMTMQVTDEVNLSSSRRRRMISDWSFSCKKPTIKTVHVDVKNAPAKKPGTVLEIPVTSKEVKTSRKEDEKKIKMAATSAPAKKSGAALGIPVTPEQPKSGRKKWTDIVKRQNSGKELKSVSTSANDDGIAVSVMVALKPLTHSKSLPVSKKQKPPKAPSLRSGVESVVLSKTTTSQKHPKAPFVKDGVDGVVSQERTPSGGEFDSLIAMSILLGILVIMMLWGMLCAIFCTCAWFIIAPRLVAATKRSATVTIERRPTESQDVLNLESVEYKKKVVMEGFLQRSHRNNVVGRL
ncbi:hypothetical protein QVD17_40806 [Tagetes erecta]|uniref:Uncharacterized protein n=1 Tax=Tagetes erecta TaxID=13708 RepID=A0AAD8NI43_TARER|nr:hypothetical protein QVD17_40806 [Tagetes erecta]